MPFEENAISDHFVFWGFKLFTLSFFVLSLAILSALSLIGCRLYYFHLFRGFCAEH